VTNWFWFIYLKIWGSGPLQWGYCNKIFHLYFHFLYFDGVLNTQKLWCQGSHYLFCDSKLPLFQENYFLYEISKSKTWIWKFKIITICCPQYLHNFKIITIILFAIQFIPFIPWTLLVSYFIISLCCFQYLSQTYQHFPILVEFFWDDENNKTRLSSYKIEKVSERLCSRLDLKFHWCK
jgi:hypothetical protein